MNPNVEHHTLTQSEKISNGIPGRITKVGGKTGLVF
jgi:hypothetical protein